MYEGDLNSLTSPGVYSVQNGSNYPNGTNAIVIVIKYSTNVVRQFYFRTGTVNSTDMYWYTRTINSGSSSYGDWERLANVTYVQERVKTIGIYHHTYSISVNSSSVATQAVKASDFSVSDATWAGVVYAMQMAGSPFYQNVDIGFSSSSTPTGTEDNLGTLKVYNGYSSTATVKVEVGLLTIQR